MSPIANMSLDLMQSGVESTAGTAVAATSKVAVEELEFDDAAPSQVTRPRILNGVAGANPGYEQVARRGMNWTARGPAVFSQLQNLLGMVIATDAAPTGVGPYTWTHTLDPTSAPGVDERTLERRITDGSTADDSEWAYGVCNRLRLSWADGDVVRMEASGFGRRRQDSTLTAAQSLPAIVLVPSALSTVFIDTAWANLGNTQVTGEVLSWDLTFTNGLFPRYAADGRSDLDFSLAGWNSRGLGLEFNLRTLVEQSSGQYATEETAAEAQSLRAVRINIAGSGNEDLTLDFLCKHAAGGLPPIAEDESEHVVDMPFVYATDQTNALSAVLINDIAALT